MSSLKPTVDKLEMFIFWSRWLQAPLYLGLIIAQIAYCLSVHARTERIWSTTSFSAPTRINEVEVMLVVLGLIDVVMIANLLIMVIIGGYETFVSRLDLDGHPDQPEWLSHVNAGVLKIKLSTAIIGISSIHLLKTFINARQHEPAYDHVAGHHPCRLPGLGTSSMVWVDRVMTQTLALSRSTPAGKH
jgi:uncharacterized protein (TIGR00645 family)